MNLYNQLFYKTILNYSKIKINEFDKNTDLVNNFVDHAATTNNITLHRSDENKIIKFKYNNFDIGEIIGLRPNTTLRPAFEICRNKFTLENYLTLMGINTLKSNYFSKNDKKLAQEFIENNTNYSFVLKPLSLAGGKGIMLDVNKDNFNTLWDESIKIQNENNIVQTGCIVQHFVRGFDIRVSIVEGKYTAALLRLPAHVIGDGNHTIIELINSKNSQRMTIPYYRNKLIPQDDKVESYLKRKNLSFDFIPKINDIVLLSDISNLTLGGESIDITYKLSKDIINLAVNSVAAVPGLYSAGVDIMAENYLDGNGYVIEINTHANLTMHYLPLKGKQQFPYHNLINHFLINYKANNGIELTSKDMKSYVRYNNFLKLKTNYAAKLEKSNFKNLSNM